MRGPGRLPLLLLGSVGYAVALVATRGFPTRASDSGLFLTIAGRMLDGDSLYVDVVDGGADKDPLFHYAYAAALAVGGWRGPFMLDAVWVALAALGSFLLLRELGANRLTAIAGFIAYPLLLTFGLWYYAGYSMLAAISLVPLIGWLWLTRKFMLAGALVAVGILFKVNLGLVLLSPLVALAAVRLPPGPLRPALTRAATGLAVAVASAAVILALRGELIGYVEELYDNVGYSSQVLGIRDRPTGLIGHFAVIRDTLVAPFGAIFGIALALGAGIAAAALTRHPSAGDAARGPTRAIAALLVAALVAATITIGFTAAWAHHAQILAFPGLMLVALLVAYSRAGRANLARAAAAAMSALVMVGVLVYQTPGPGNPHADGWSPSVWLEAGPQSPYAEALERAAEISVPGGGEVGFARLGPNDDDGFAAFLDQRFDLVCPMIAQYPVITPEPAEAARCIETRAPCLILVTSLEPWPGDAEWNRFVARSSALLERRYELVGSEGAGEVYALRNCASTT